MNHKVYDDPMELKIDNLACRRAGRQVFAGLDFQLPAGQAAVLRGPNGVGKSTLLRVLAGLLPPNFGTARIGQTDLIRDRSAYQENVAYSGHLDAVKLALTVWDNLALWSTVNGGHRKRIDQALDRFGLSPIANRMAAECSAGQKRRLGLARLLIVEKPLWLLDEPTVSLDHEAKGLIAELIDVHVKQGGLALVATHEDLGLPDLKTLEMTRQHVGAPLSDADPFLEGAW